MIPAYFRKKIVWIPLLAVVIYLLLISPIFFVYPKYDESQPIHHELEDYFNDLSDSLTGDCYRKSQKFIIENVLPTREVHLNSEHTIVEINIKGKWIAYDPLYKMFFGNKNAIQVSFDITRGYIPEYMKNYPFVNSFKNIKYYHSKYYVFLKYICPFYDAIMRRYYSVL
jgi:hypothetical protein